MSEGGELSVGWVAGGWSPSFMDIVNWEVLSMAEEASTVVDDDEVAIKKEKSTDMM